jgi:hypothetical protein
MKMTREGLLNDLKQKGLTTAEYIKNGRYEGWNTSYEQIYHRALQLAWMNISNNADMVKELEQIKKTIKTRIPYNHISLLIIAVSTGFTTEWWDVVDDKLVSIGKPCNQK